MMGKLLEGFKILCSDFDHTYFGKKGDIIQERILIKEIRYLPFLNFMITNNLFWAKKILMVQKSFCTKQIISDPNLS